jgi:HAD superfamily hydrolase (TIGR01509 family)
MLNGIKVALFDVDGTLIDSMPTWSKSTTDYLKMNGKEVPDGFMKTIATLGYNNAIVYMKEEFNLQDSIDEIKRQVDDTVLKSYQYDILAKSNTEKYLKYLESIGMDCYVITAGLRKFFMPCLTRLDYVKYFKELWTSEDFNLKKSDKEIYLEIAKKLGVKPEEIIFFDDSIHAVTGAKSAGLKVVGVYDERSKEDREEITSYVDKYIENFDELM